MHNTFVCFCLLSLSVVFVRFIQVLAHICSWFTFVAIELSMVWWYQLFPYLWLVISAAMTIPVYVFLVKTSIGAVIRSGLAGPCSMCMYIHFSRHWETVFQVVVSVYIATSNTWQLHSLGNTWYCLPFDFSCSGGCVEISHCGFNLHFPEDECSWAPFHVYWPLDSTFRVMEMSGSSLW